MKHAVQQIHFVGIGGSGMSGIAEVLLGDGYRVSGSDLGSNEATQRLAQLGAQIFRGHARSQIGQADVVVISSAVSAENPEVQAARAQGIPVIPRAEMLAELMRTRRAIAVAGAHGKTTTTSLIASVLTEAKLDPTFVIGGRLQSAGSHARLGHGEWMVAEADESDASFLSLAPLLAVITNIDYDHMATYDHDPQKLLQAYLAFIHRLPFYGVVALCLDDPLSRSILPRIARRVLSFGLDAQAQYRASQLRSLRQAAGEPAQMQFTLHRPARADIEVTLNLAGEHNVRNALSAIAIADEMGIADAPLLHALKHFRGVARRFQVSVGLPVRAGNGGGTFTLVDDYGHHPAELRATLAAARLAFPGRRIVLAFQPHRFTRTRDCFEDFVGVLGRQADRLLLAPVYAAGEAPIAGADAQALLRAIRASTNAEPIFVEDIAQMPQRILEQARAEDVVMCMGAGSIGAVPALVRQLTGAQP